MDKEDLKLVEQMINQEVSHRIAMDKNNYLEKLNERLTDKVYDKVDSLNFKVGTGLIGIALIWFITLISIASKH